MKWLEKLAAAFALMGGLCALLVAAMTLWSVIGRNLFAHPVQGDIELSQIGIALAIALCLPWCQLRRGNIIVDFFTQAAPERVNGALDRFGALLLAVMLGLLAWRTGMGALAVDEAGEQTMILGLPMWWAYAILAPGLALTAVIAVAQAVRRGDA
ncbi:TRAP-type C4-dicarboxylate transport system permease small subunit [Pelomonas saccharophila]|uniref:TRAP transporter small permease protein n=1 Tax=Roseateles saccharophilus TaxID=304 RepID=A0ABU1YS17_ROSSA|nr:TRAP transporter small permease [Roseateles saccharophilus]MDR7271649.1 TRAP-type C4-dicarboxylate transport system permease small subunit [Roseateles saccharophilus]